jgi:hypothetical protein
MEQIQQGNDYLVNGRDATRHLISWILPIDQVIPLDFE